MKKSRLLLSNPAANFLALTGLSLGSFVTAWFPDLTGLAQQMDFLVGFLVKIGSLVGIYFTVRIGSKTLKEKRKSK